MTEGTARGRDGLQPVPPTSPRAHRGLEDPLLIIVWQAGGFAGGEPIRIHRVDTSELPEARRERLERRLAALKQALEETGAPVGADLVEYTIEVEADGVRETFTVADDMDPANPTGLRLRELLAELSST